MARRDGKPDGSWPGRDGAKAVAERLAGHWNETVDWALPSGDAKDLRAWLAAQFAAGLDADDAGAMHKVGQHLLSVLKQNAKSAKPVKRSQADALVDLALSHFRLGRTESDDTFAVELDGPAVAVMFRGGKDALRAKLSKLYRQTTGRTPNASALTDALMTLEGQARDANPEPVALRVAELAADPSDDADGLSQGSSSNTIVLDLGDSTGRAVVLTPDGWSLSDASPVLFKRTALTGVLPEPANLHDPAALLGLRELLNVTDDAWPLMVGWLVASFFPTIPHPILMLGGEQGTGKSTAARLMFNLVDPSPALLRSEPRDVEQWAIAAAGSHCVCIDNISRIPPWWSDALCKAVTGDASIRRKLYTDGDLAVLAFRRCVVLTSIDAGALRGDLGDRLLLIDLERITEQKRRTEANLDEAYREFRPRLIAGLHSAVCRTLAVLPEVTLETMPRMADFAHVLAALDRACPELTGGRALDLYTGQRGRIATDVVESDEVAAAVVRLLETGSGVWTGTAGELLQAILPERPDKHWPANARAMTARLKRIAPALRQVGIEHTPPDTNDKTRTHRLEITGNRPPEPPETTCGEPPAAMTHGPSNAAPGGPHAETKADRPSDRPG